METKSVLTMSSWPLYPDGSLWSFIITQFTLLILYTVVILLVPAHATVTRITSLVALSTLTYMLQEMVIQLCKNPHWRAAAVPLLWIQFMSASELIWVSRVDKTHVSASRGKTRVETIPTQAMQVVTLLWNLRRVGTRWQVKNISASQSSESTSQSRLRFVLRRLTTTFLAYLIVDIMIAGPSPDVVLVSSPKETLFKLSYLSLEDVIFRIIGTVSFWLITALFNLILTNSTAILFVISGLSAPSDCPPLYGPIGDAYSVRQFWG